MRTGLVPSSLLLLILPTVGAITLTDFQPINGFSSQCTEAYNTPLQGCTLSDFQGGHGCSPSCITFLEALTKMLNTDCKGTSAFPNTLIGLFFSQQGTSTLCPNVLGSSGGEAENQASYSSAASPSTSTEGQHKSSIVVSWTSAPTTSASEITSPSSAASSSSSLIASGSESASSTIITVQTSVASPGSLSIATSSTNSASSTAISSKSSSAPGASNTGKEANSGGGTILELGSTGAAPSTLVFNFHSWASLGIFVVLVGLL